MSPPANDAFKNMNPVEDSKIREDVLTVSGDTLVSIVILTFNSAEFIVDALESARLQTYPILELIIADDCSSDKTIDICQGWLEQNASRFLRVAIVRAPVNSGIPANCNRGLAAAQGAWIKFLAGDDALNITCVQRYVDHLRRHTDSLVLYSNVQHFRDQFSDDCCEPIYPTHQLRISKPEIGAKEQFEILLRSNKIWAGSLFFSRKVFDRVGWFDEALKFWEDRPMLLKITGAGIRLHYVHFVSCKYRKHTGSVQQARKRGELISRFALERDEYFLQNYAKHLPPFERFVTTTLARRGLLLDKYGLNNDSLLARAYMKLTAEPWSYLKRWLSRKYV